MYIFKRGFNNRFTDFFLIRNIFLSEQYRKQFFFFFHVSKNKTVLSIYFSKTKV